MAFIFKQTTIGEVGVGLGEVGVGKGSVMNILFRKNLSEGGGGSKERFGKGAVRGGRGKVKQKPRPSTAFEDHYGLRTHIFLSPALQAEASSDWGQRDSCGGIQSRYSSSEGISTGLTSRRPSLQLKVQWRTSATPRLSDFGSPEVGGIS